MTVPKSQWAPRAAIPRVSFAQNMEDILLDRLFRGEVGTFMDVGANHPTLDSNTYFFYLRGWRGVNLEPIPRQHALFLQQRPEDLNLAVAASDADGQMTFYEIASGRDETGHSTLEAAVAGADRGPDFAVRSYPVPTRTVGSLVREYGLAPPEILTVDVECHEEAVLRGIPLETWRPKVLVIESLVPLSHAENFAAWEPILLRSGYLFGATNGVNRFYLREDLRDRLGLLQAPVNCTDQYEKHETVALRARAEESARRAVELGQNCDRLRGEGDAVRAQLAEARAVRERERERAAEAQAARERERSSWERERADAARERFAWERERVAWERERAEVAQERSSWERERAEAAAALQALEACRQQERASWAVIQQDLEATRQRWEALDAERERDRGSWATALRSLEASRQQERAAEARAREAAEAERQRERAQWQQALEAQQRFLAEAQLQLRPYRLLDRLGVVNAAHGWARRVKHRLVS